MGGTNPVPNILCVHNNVEPRSQQNSSKSRVTGKNSPCHSSFKLNEFGPQRALGWVERLEIPLLAFKLEDFQPSGACAPLIAAHAALLASGSCVRSL
ncbi:hypothetical protein PIB30_057279 [Stylosanthes scabra]|uniref:Uncharacterized protein n=1 Tax=Stylosanthes scabra TaxID=79078 RepID=A0ABU6RJW2_9FABA|nr:hypothetical protein [Stylosanthes scabra]